MCRGGVRHQHQRRLAAHQRPLTRVFIRSGNTSVGSRASPRSGSRLRIRLAQTRSDLGPRSLSPSTVVGSVGTPQTGLVLAR